MSPCTTYLFLSKQELENMCSTVIIFQFLTCLALLCSSQALDSASDFDLENVSRNDSDSDNNIDRSVISKQDIFDRKKEVHKEDGIDASPEHQRKPKMDIAKIASTVIGVIGCLMIIFCICRCVMRTRTTQNNSFDQDAYDAEISALLRNK